MPLDVPGTPACPQRHIRRFYSNITASPAALPAIPGVLMVS
jgi:hypothetical protein